MGMQGGPSAQEKNRTLVHITSGTLVWGYAKLNWKSSLGLRPPNPNPAERTGREDALRTGPQRQYVTHWQGVWGEHPRQRPLLACGRHFLLSPLLWPHSWLQNYPEPQPERKLFLPFNLPSGAEACRERCALCVSLTKPTQYLHLPLLIESEITLNLSFNFKAKCS